MYYTTNQVADLLGYTNETIRKKIRKGEISAFKVRDRLKVPKEEVKKYLLNTISKNDLSEDEKIDLVNNLIENYSEQK